MAEEIEMTINSREQCKAKELRGYIFECKRCDGNVLHCDQDLCLHDICSSMPKADMAHAIVELRKRIADPSISPKSQRVRP